MGSHNHSAVQANLAYLLKKLGQYSVYIELSLDVKDHDLLRFRVKDEILPDVCIYHKRPLSLPYDILRMQEMPLMVIEILSPRQGTGTILEKFGAYFALDIQSCWLVDPLTKTVHVYTSPTDFTTFSGGVVHDRKIGIELPSAEIFE